MEYFDVLTEDGTATGESLPREEVHNRGLWHGSVQAWVMNSDHQFLLQQRAHTKKTDPGLWDVSICGHIASGDDAIDAAIREANEELGLKLDRNQFEHLFLYVHHNEHPLTNGSIRHERLITPTYLVRAEVNLDKLKLEPTEVAAVRWIGLAELNVAVSIPPHDFAIRPDEWVQLLPLLQS
ncbi:MAG: NUDIX domain-containing protein [Patescibacteria group bacterium]